jgi:hypothetical protein
MSYPKVEFLVGNVFGIFSSIFGLTPYRLARGFYGPSWNFRQSHWLIDTNSSQFTSTSISKNSLFFCQNLSIFHRKRGRLFSPILLIQKKNDQKSERNRN